MTPPPEVIAVYAALSLYPPKLRAEIKLERDFAERHGLVVRLQIALGPEGSVFDAQKLNEAVRAVLRGSGPTDVTEKSSPKSWQCLASQGLGLPLVELVRGSVRIELPFTFALHPESETRKLGLLTSEETRGLSASKRDRWLGTLDQHTLTDDELNDLMADVRAIPAIEEGRIGDLAHADQFETRRLVSLDPMFYENLVGEHRDSKNILEYASREFIKLIDDIVDVDGFLRAVSLASGHPSISEAVATHIAGWDDSVSRSRLASEEPLDLISLACLSEVESKVTFLDVARLISLVDVARLAGEGDAPECKLLSSYFMLTDGLLVKHGLFEGQPVFWRRLASLANAALIQRVLTSGSIDADRFAKSVAALIGETFYVNGLLDLHSDPRWLPSFASAKQFRSEVLGRVLSAAEAVQTGPHSSAELAAAIERCSDLLGEEGKIARFLPGPTEGNLDAPVTLPEELRSDIRAELGARPVSVGALQKLFSSELVFRIDETLSSAALDAIRDVIVSGQNFAGVVEGELIPRLAHVAAVTRDEDLAAEVRNLSRLARRSSPPRIDVRQEFQTALIGRAAFKDVDAADRFLASWMKEIVRAESSKEDARALLSHLRCILRRRPGLWSQLSESEAVLSARAARVA